MQAAPGRTTNTVQRKQGKISTTVVQYSDWLLFDNPVQQHIVADADKVLITGL